MQIAVIDPLDQLLPITDAIVPPNRADYLRDNILWDADSRTIRLSTCRGAWSGFQLAIKHPDPATILTCGVSTIPGTRLEAFRYEYVESAQGAMADPLIPVGQASELERGIALIPSVKSPQLGCWLFELHTPSTLEPGEYRGRLELNFGADTCSIELRIAVGSQTMPSQLRFLPEMNCYDLPANERDYYRLGNRHRVVVNRVPYYQNGALAEGMAPKGAVGRWDWSAWDQRFSQYLDGSAFEDLPRGRVPIECFYFPMHENWPLPMEGNYNGSYWADEAFPESYRSAWEQTVADFAEHADQRAWWNTRFHVFLNNKVDFKKRGWSRGSSPWLLDEPANFQDYRALQFYGLAAKSGATRSQGNAKVLFRADISRPQWQRTTLDGLLGYNVVSQSAFREYRRLVLDRKRRDAQTLLVYGSSNSIGTNNAQSVAWAWDAWCSGADGIVPWQTIGTNGSWNQADELALLYPHPTDAKLPPVPSIRLKAYCYGQQDAELLHNHWLVAAERKGVDRYEWGAQMLSELGLRSISRAITGTAEEALWTDYGTITPEAFESWRRRLQR